MHHLPEESANECPIQVCCPPIPHPFQLTHPPTVTPREYTTDPYEVDAVAVNEEEDPLITDSPHVKEDSDVPLAEPTSTFSLVRWFSQYGLMLKLFLLITTVCLVLAVMTMPKGVSPESIAHSHNLL